MPNIFTVNAHNNSSINWAQKSLQKQTIKPNLKFYCDTGYRNHGTLEGDHFLHRPLLFNAHARGPAPGAEFSHTLKRERVGEYHWIQKSRHT